MAAALRLLIQRIFPDTVSQIAFVFTIEKYSKMMTSDELLIKFKEDGVNAKAETPESTVGGENLLSLKKSTCK